MPRRTQESRSSTTRSIPISISRLPIGARSCRARPGPRFTRRRASFPTRTTFPTSFSRDRKHRSSTARPGWRRRSNLPGPLTSTASCSSEAATGTSSSPWPWRDRTISAERPSPRSAGSPWTFSKTQRFSGPPCRAFTFSSHYDEVRNLPAAEFIVLAESETCSVQAFRTRDGRVWGFQMHPEMQEAAAREYLEGCLKAFPFSRALCEEALASQARDSGLIHGIVDGFLRLSV